MSKVTGLIPPGGEANGFDLNQRDPNNLNEHLQVLWDDVFGEPEGVRSNDCAWRTSYKCFHGTRYKLEKLIAEAIFLIFPSVIRSCCYLLLTALFAPCMAFFAAINFACLAFNVSIVLVFPSQFHNHCSAHLVFGALFEDVEN